MTSGSPISMGLEDRFRAGTVVLLSLSNPREKFWGVLLQLSQAGVVLRGVDLSSFDETVRMLRHEEPVSPMELFFPMHRVERIETDAPSCGLPSLSERFDSGSGIDVRTFLQF